MRPPSAQEIEEHVIEGILVKHPEVFLMARVAVTVQLVTQYLFPNPPISPGEGK